MELKEAKRLDALLQRARRHEINVDNDDVDDVNHLLDDGYIEVTHSRGNDISVITATPEGCRFINNGGYTGILSRLQESRKQERKKARVDWARYLVDTAISIASLVVGYILGACL